MIVELVIAALGICTTTLLSLKTVHLGYATKDFHALIEGDIYLPETTWAENEECRRKAGIPDHVVFREKWRIALDLLERTIANGVSFKYLTADEEYGRSGGLRRGVVAHGIQYVVEVPCSMSGWTRRPPMLGPEDYSGVGRHRVRLSLAPDGPAAEERVGEYRLNTRPLLAARL